MLSTSEENANSTEVFNNTLRANNIENKSNELTNFEFIVTNARSLSPKIQSLVDSFEEF